MRASESLVAKKIKRKHHLSTMKNSKHQQSMNNSDDLLKHVVFSMFEGFALETFPRQKCLKTKTNLILALSLGQTCARYLFAVLRKRLAQHLAIFTRAVSFLRHELVALRVHTS